MISREELIDCLKEYWEQCEENFPGKSSNNSKDELLNQKEIYWLKSLYASEEILHKNNSNKIIDALFICISDNFIEFCKNKKYDYYLLWNKVVTINLNREYKIEREYQYTNDEYKENKDFEFNVNKLVESFIDRIMLYYLLDLESRENHKLVSGPYDKIIKTLTKFLFTEEAFDAHIYIKESDECSENNFDEKDEGQDQDQDQDQDEDEDQDQNEDEYKKNFDIDEENEKILIAYLIENELLVGKYLESNTIPNVKDLERIIEKIALSLSIKTEDVSLNTENNLNNVNTDSTDIFDSCLQNILYLFCACGMSRKSDKRDDAASNSNNENSIPNYGTFSPR